MNASESINLSFFIDTDNAPFILFDHRGTIRYLNDAAEVLMAYADTHTLYDLALTHAPKTFGSRTTPVELRFRQLSFYAINVAYQNESHIGMRLYYRPHPKSSAPSDTRRMKQTNINILLEAAITQFAMQNSAPFDLLTDADLPDCMIDQNGFSKLLRKSLHLFRASSDLHISLTMAIGESIVVHQKRHPIVRLKIRANGRYSHDDSVIKSLAETMQIIALLEERHIQLDIPYIPA